MHGHKTSHLPIRYFLALLWAHPILHVSMIRVNYKTDYFLILRRKQGSVPVAARSKEWVCSRSPAEIAGSNPAGGMDFCCECCVLLGRGLCVGLITRPEESYQLWCAWVWSWIPDNEEILAHGGGLFRNGKKTGTFHSVELNSVWSLPSSILLRSGDRSSW